MYGLNGFLKALCHFYEISAEIFYKMQWLLWFTRSDSMFTTISSDLTNVKH